MEKREVNFNGAKLLAVKDQGKMYVAVIHICNSLGMDKSKSDNQVQKIQSDETLKIGIKKLRLKIQAQVRELMFIELDCLPLWLAKINPARFSNQLKKKLLEYQLHAKDVLAAAFLNNKPKQLPPTPKERKIIKKYYNGVPVMSTMDLSVIIGRTVQSIIRRAGKNKTMIHKYEMLNFKKENPNLPVNLTHMAIYYREEAINICKRMGVYNFVKPQILAYFDDFIPEADKVSSDIQEVTTDQNMKAEKLLRVLPHISDENLKNQVAVEVIRLIDNKILEEYKNNGLHMRFIDSNERIIEYREGDGYRMAVVKTDKPIVEHKEPGLVISNINGNKMIVEKIK